MVGGGLAGLTAAYHLAVGGVRVVLFEKAARLGGQIHSELCDGFVIDHGAEGYAAGRRSVTDLCAELNITGRLVSQMPLDSLALRGPELVAISSSQAARLAGIQTERGDFGQGIMSLKQGMGELVEALVSSLSGGIELRAGSPVTRLAREGGAWVVALGPGEQLRAQAVVIAAFPHAAATLVRPWSPRAAELLASLGTASSVSVSLACAREAVAHQLDASGFVVDQTAEAAGFRACVFVSSKFPGRAPEGHVLLRAFFRPGPGPEINAPDSVWIDRAVQAVWPVLGVSGPPARSWVARWPDALPRYRSRHDESVASCAAWLRQAGPIELAGAGYRRSGVAAAVESGRAAARRILEGQP